MQNFPILCGYNHFQSISYSTVKMFAVFAVYGGMQDVTRHLKLPLFKTGCRPLLYGNTHQQQPTIQARSWDIRRTVSPYSVSINPGLIVGVGESLPRHTSWLHSLWLGMTFLLPSYIFPVFGFSFARFGLISEFVSFQTFKVWYGGIVLWNSYCFLSNMLSSD